MERGFIYVVLVQFLLSLSWQIIHILLVIYTATFNAPALLGTLWSVIGLSRFLAETPGGILVDRFGRRPVIVGGLASVIASFIRFVLAQTATDVLVSGALAGTGFAISHIALLIQASDYAPPVMRVKYMGILNGSMVASAIVGPIIGCFIAQYFELSASFIASTLVVSTALLITIIAIRDPEKAEGSATKREGILQDYRVFMNNRLYLALFFVSFLFALVGWSFGSIVFPTYGKDVLSLTIVQIGLLSSVTSAVLFFEQFLLSGVMERHFSRRLLITFGFLICGVAVYSFSIVSDLYGLTAASAVLGMGLGLVNPSLEAIWIDITKAEERGRVYGVRIAFFDFGQISWSMIITLIMNIDPRLPFYAIASAALLNAALLFQILRKPY